MTKLAYNYDLTHDDELDMQDRIARRTKFAGRSFSDCNIITKEYT